MNCFWNSQPKEIYGYIAAANYIENIGDVVETDITDSFKRMHTLSRRISNAVIEVKAISQEGIMDARHS
jgi:hypothetical protein